VSENRPTVGDIVDAIGASAPWHWAADWDQVGLLAGDTDAAAKRVLVTLDPSAQTVIRAAAQGFDVIVSHHPVFLEPPRRLVGGMGGPGGVVSTALRAGISLIAAHTNLDRHPDAAANLARMLGFTPGPVLEQASMSRSVVVAYVPMEAADMVRDAMSEAGAGTVGAYTGCSFSHEGEGRFTAGQGSHPARGARGANNIDEIRIEMSCPAAITSRVLNAARDAHPYETPVVLAHDIQIARVDCGLGCVCAVEPTDLAALSTHVAGRAKVAPRVWGDAKRRVSRVAIATGSAGSLIGDALAANADVLIGGEVRYHDAMDASDAGLSIIELGHDVSEWPLVPLLGSFVARTPGLASDSIDIDPPSIRWWTA